MPRLTIAACASLPQRRICVRPWNAQKIAAILASGAAVGLGAGSGVALRERIGHSSNNSSKQSRNNDRQTHGKGGGLEVGVDLLVSGGSLVDATGDPFILVFILVQLLCVTLTIPLHSGTKTCQPHQKRRYKTLISSRHGTKQALSKVY